MNGDRPPLPPTLALDEAHTARLARALEATRELTAPREAWEALAVCELVPFEWVDSDSRSFVYDGQRAYYPPTVPACVTVAVHASRIAAAEALAREISQYVGSPRARIRWDLRSPRWYTANAPRSLNLNEVLTPEELSAMIILDGRPHVEARIASIDALGLRFHGIEGRDLALSLPLLAGAHAP